LPPPLIRLGTADTKTDTKGVKQGIAGLCRIMLNSQ
jgi:hypothetical protein